MSINLVYPITRTHEHLAMRDDKSVIAFYRILIPPSQLLMPRKRQTQNHSRSND